MSRKRPYARYEELKSLAADLIEDYALSYPADPFELAALLGVNVTIHDQGLPPFEAWFCDTSEGYTEPSESEHGVRFHSHVNGAVPWARQRFTLMHELAHVWLDHWRTGESLTDEQAEGEANFLASYVLAPDVLILAWAPGLEVASIAETFQMSDEAARFAHDRAIRALNAVGSSRHYDERIRRAVTRRLRRYQVTGNGDNRMSA